MVGKARVKAGVQNGGEFDFIHRNVNLAEPPPAPPEEEEVTERKRLYDWNDLDLSDEEIRRWKQARFSADGAYAWGYGGGCGFTPERAKEWRSIGIHDPYMADQWSAHGFSPKETEEWAKCGFMSFGKDKPELWREVGFPDPSEAQAWRKARFNHAQALSWKEAGLTPAEAKLEASATKNRFHHIPDMYTKHSPKELQNLDAEYELPFGVYRSKDWKRLGFSPDAVSAWEAADKNPYEAAELREQLIGKARLKQLAENAGPSNA
jgi:hypothetical protein